MNLLQLKYFQEVARLEHMTKAAESLNVSQPSISNTISRLEKEMKKASKMLEFEYAAVLRDKIIQLRAEK